MDPPWGVSDSHGSLWDRCRPTWRGECRTQRRGSKRRAETSGTLPHPGVGVGDCLRISRQRPALRTSSCSPASPGCRLLLGLPATCPPRTCPLGGTRFCRLCLLRPVIGAFPPQIALRSFLVEVALVWQNGSRVCRRMCWPPFHVLSSIWKAPKVTGQSL